MTAKTKIEWTDATWNPILGCSRVSEGCRYCYAETIAGRFAHGKPSVYSGLTVVANGHAQWTGKIVETRQLLDPLRWRRPRRVFANSMSDLFHENLTDEQRDRIFAVMGLAWQHSFQILTKRPQRMLSYMQGLAAGDPAERLGNAAYELEIDEDFCNHLANWINGWSRWREAPDDGNPLNGTKPRWPLPNVWMGVSVEDQEAADERIKWLLRTPAALRFISAEPLLGPIDFSLIRTAAGGFLSPDTLFDNGDDAGLDWIICGGESGPRARPMMPIWAESIRDQCARAGVAFFMKQMGSAYGPAKGHDVPSGLDIKQFPTVQQ